MEEKILSVSQYIDGVNNKLRDCGAKIIGEVTCTSFGPTGHVYFQLKDDDNQSVLKCMIFKTKYDVYGVEIKDGVKIIVFGSPCVHKQYGFSLIAETIEYAGEGILKEEYEKLKKKLTKEGIFEDLKKRPLPKYPKKIGIITSLRGAVIADFSNNLGKFGFKIKIVDSRVEGQIAVSDLLAAIEVFKSEDIEILVIMRGGGSLESLIAFNNEKLTREIANFPVPVIAAIGHDKDVPLIALAADMSVSTPTAAANILNEPWKEALLILERNERKVMDSYRIALVNTQKKVIATTETIRKYYEDVFNGYNRVKDKLIFSFGNFQKALFSARNCLETATRDCSGFKSLISTIGKRIEYSEKMIISHNPERLLARGYSIVRCGDKIIRRISDVRVGEDISLRIVDGTINSKIININKQNE